MGHPSLTSRLRTRLWLEDLDKIEVPMALRPDLPFGPVTLPPTHALEAPLPGSPAVESPAWERPSLAAAPPDYPAVLSDVVMASRATVASDLRPLPDDRPADGGAQRDLNQLRDLFHPAAVLDAGGEVTPAAEIARTLHPGGPDLMAPTALTARDHLFAGQTDRAFARGVPEREAVPAPLKPGAGGADVPRAPIQPSLPPGKRPLPKSDPAASHRSPLSAPAGFGAQVGQPASLGQGLRGGTANAPQSLNQSALSEIVNMAVVAVVASPGFGSDGASSFQDGSSLVVSPFGLVVSNGEDGPGPMSQALSTLVAWNTPDSTAPPSQSGEPAGPSDAAPDVVSDVLGDVSRSSTSGARPGVDAWTGTQAPALPTGLGVLPAVRDAGASQPFMVAALVSPVAPSALVYAGYTSGPGVPQGAPAPGQEPVGGPGAGGRNTEPGSVPAALARQPLPESALVPASAKAAWGRQSRKPSAGNLVAAVSPTILPLRLSTQGMPKPPVLETRRTRRRSNLAKWLGTEKATLAIVFTDVIDSTGLWNSLGNENMIGVLRTHFEQGCRLAEVHQGYMIRTTGDSLLLAFRTAAAALDFALTYAARTGHGLIQIRAGIHVGPVQVEDNDVYGTTINYAARVIAKAKGAEIWVSSRAQSDIEEERTRGQGALQWMPHRRCTLKGFSGKHLLWSVIQADDV